MDSFRIRGGNRLKGKIEISGSKNSALPIVAAALMSSEKMTLHGVPRLSDITSMTKLVGELGAHVRRHDPLSKTVGDGPDLNGPLDIEVVDEQQCEARYDIVKTMRASICVLGPLLAKRGKAIVSIPGGCAIGDRPVDLHVRGLQKLGAEFTTEGGNIVGTVRGRLQGVPAVPGRGPGADRAGHDQRHVRRRPGRGRDGARGRRLRAGGGRLRRPAKQDGRPHPRPRHARDPHRGRRPPGRRRPPHHPRPDRVPARSSWPPPSPTASWTCTTATWTT